MTLRELLCGVTMLTPADAVRTYILAKDVGQGGRPAPHRRWPLRRAFDGEARIEKLVITAEVMEVMAADNPTAVMDWSSVLPYPWCSVERPLTRLPAVHGARRRQNLSETGRTHRVRILSLPAQ